MKEALILCQTADGPMLAIQMVLSCRSTELTQVSILSGQNFPIGKGRSAHEASPCPVVTLRLHTVTNMGQSLLADSVLAKLLC